jgi:hypothetical protein
MFPLRIIIDIHVAIPMDAPTAEGTPTAMLILSEVERPWSLSEFAVPPVTLEVAEADALSEEGELVKEVVGTLGVVMVVEDELALEELEERVKGSDLSEEVSLEVVSAAKGSRAVSNSISVTGVVIEPPDSQSTPRVQQDPTASSNAGGKKSQAKLLMG